MTHSLRNANFALLRAVIVIERGTPPGLEHVRQELKVYSENNQSQNRPKDSQQPEDEPHTAADNECN